MDELGRTPLKAIEFLKSLPRGWLPNSLDNGIREPSNGQLMRWLKDKAVIINGKRPSPFEEIDFPITELVFFPSSKHRATIID